MMRRSTDAQLNMQQRQQWPHNDDDGAATRSTATQKKSATATSGSGSSQTQPTAIDSSAVMALSTSSYLAGGRSILNTSSISSTLIRRLLQAHQSSDSSSARSGGSGEEEQWPMKNKQPYKNANSTARQVLKIGTAATAATSNNQTGSAATATSTTTNARDTDTTMSSSAASNLYKINHYTNVLFSGGSSSSSSSSSDTSSSDSEQDSSDFFTVSSSCPKARQHHDYHNNNSNRNTTRDLPWNNLRTKSSSAQMATLLQPQPQQRHHDFHLGNKSNNNLSPDGIKQNYVLPSNTTTIATTTTSNSSALPCKNYFLEEDSNSISLFLQECQSMYQPIQQQQCHACLTTGNGKNHEVEQGEEQQQLIFTNEVKTKKDHIKSHQNNADISAIDFAVPLHKDEATTNENDDAQLSDQQHLHQISKGHDVKSNPVIPTNDWHDTGTVLLSESFTNNHTDTSIKCKSRLVKSANEIRNPTDEQEGIDNFHRQDEMNYSNVITLDQAITPINEEARILTTSHHPFTVVHANAAFSRLTGIDVHLVLGKLISNIISPSSTKTFTTTSSLSVGVNKTEQNSVDELMNMACVVRSMAQDRIHGNIILKGMEFTIEIIPIVSPMVPTDSKRYVFGNDQPLASSSSTSSSLPQRQGPSDPSSTRRNVPRRTDENEVTHLCVHMQKSKSVQKQRRGPQGVKDDTLVVSMDNNSNNNNIDVTDRSGNCEKEGAQDFMATAA